MRIRTACSGRHACHERRSVDLSAGCRDSHVSGKLVLHRAAGLAGLALVVRHGRCHGMAWHAGVLLHASRMASISWSKTRHHFVVGMSMIHSVDIDDGCSVLSHALLQESRRSGHRFAARVVAWDLRRSDWSRRRKRDPEVCPEERRGRGFCSEDGRWLELSKGLHRCSAGRTARDD
jgi:hypothetical protein